MQQPAIFDLHLYRAADFVRTWSVEDSAGVAVDLSAYQFAARVVDSADATLLDGAQANPSTGEIVITGAADGTLTLVIKQADIDAIDADTVNGEWSMNAHDGDYLHPWMVGRVIIHGSALA